jgi:hypothetical protein
MKKIGFSLAFCALLFAANGLAQDRYMPYLIKESIRKSAEQLKSGTIGNYPQHTVEYTWGTTDWVLFRTIETSYKSFGEPDVIEYQQGENTTREMYFYNDQHQQTQVTTQEMVGGSWADQSRYLTTYNNQGLGIEYSYEEWIGSAWVRKNGSQVTFEMDGDRVSVMTSKNWEESSSTWVFSMRETYSYAAAGLHFASVIMDMWDNAWVPTLKSEYTWSGDRYTQSLDYTYEEGVWVLSRKTTYEYEGATSAIWTSYSYIGEDTWMALSRMTLLYDSHGNTTLNQTEMMMPDWTVFSATKFLLTYSGNNLTERIIQSYSMFPPAAEGAARTIQWRNVMKEVYSNFASMSTDVTPLETAGITVFPNPAGTQATISLSLLKTGLVTLQVISINGQKIVEETFTASGLDVNYQLNLKKVPRGSYLLIASDKQGVEIGKARLIRQ